MTQSLRSFSFSVYLAFLSIIGFLSTDMYLPAFSEMQSDFGTSKAAIGASLSLFLGGFALAQLLWGPISDKYGKPKAVLFGLTLFVISSLGLFFTHSIFLFLLLRVVQAIGACAATVSWQAMVIEWYPKEKIQKIFASIMPLVALSPALAPLLGVYILKHFGWRFIFLVLSLIAILLIGYNFTVRSKKASKMPTSAQKSNFKSYFTLLQSKKYLGNILIYGLCSAGFFAWLTGAPFFLKSLGYSDTEIGFSFVPQTIAFMLGGYGYRFLSDKINGVKLIPFILMVYAISMFVLLALSFFTIPTLLTLLIPFCVMAFVNGACYPIVVNEALNIFPKNTGKASALQNTVQLGMCFIASGIVSLFSKEALLSTAVVMAGTAVLVFFAYRLTKG